MICNNTDYLQHHGLSPFKLKKDSYLLKDLAFTCGEIRKKASFCYGHYVMSVTEMFLTPLQQECQMWQKQLSENLFCIDFNKFCYADKILEIKLCPSITILSLTACLLLFQGFYWLKINSLSFPLTTEYTFGKLFPEHFRIYSF